MSFKVGDIVTAAHDELKEWQYSVEADPWYDAALERQYFVLKHTEAPAGGYPFVVETKDWVKFTPAPKPLYAPGDKVETTNHDTFEVVQAFVEGTDVYYVVRTPSGKLSFYGERGLAPFVEGPWKAGDQFYYTSFQDDLVRTITRVDGRFVYYTIDADFVIDKDFEYKAGVQEIAKVITKVEVNA